MSDFTPIATQEQFDEAIKDRLARSEKKWQEKYSGYLSPDDVAAKLKDYEKQIADFGSSLDNANKKAKADAEAIASLQAKIKEYETASVKSRIAHEIGIPYELANRLSGETEEDIRKDAEALKPLVTQKTTAPLRNPEGGEGKGGTTTAQKFADWANQNFGG